MLPSSLFRRIIKSFFLLYNFNINKMLFQFRWMFLRRTFHLVLFHWVDRQMGVFRMIESFYFGIWSQLVPHRQFLIESIKTARRKDQSRNGAPKQPHLNRISVSYRNSKWFGFKFDWLVVAAFQSYSTC